MLVWESWEKGKEAETSLGWKILLMKQRPKLSAEVRGILL